MSQVIVEDRFVSLFDTLPEQLDSNGIAFKPLYDYGSHEDLLRWLNSRRKENATRYPLIWLETPVRRIGKADGDVAAFRANLILATLAESTASNRERVEISIKPNLMLLYNNVIKAIRMSGFTRFVDREKEALSIFYNYGSNGENEATDVWDALKFESSIIMDTCPLKEFNYD